ncbi:unnamed protein product [Rhodiola kirilowii]
MDQFTGRARLPNFAVPNRYDLTLKPDLDACTFSGSVHIDLDIVSGHLLYCPQRCRSHSRSWLRPVQHSS